MNPSHELDNYFIYTDAATSPQHVISIGAFIILDQQLIEQYSKSTDDALFANIVDKIVYIEYVSKKSTWSEIKTAIDALNFVHKKSTVRRKCEIYTDCQSLCDLINERREKLEKNKFMTRSGNILANTALYKELFAIADKFPIKVFKIKGHAPSTHRFSVHEKIFTILDKLCRKKLRTCVL